MTRYLLDTHVILWLATSPKKLSKSSLEMLQRADDIFVSPASSYEIANKYKLSKLPQGFSVLTRWSELLQNLMGKELPLTHQVMMHAALLDWHHRDPFDRMLVATAQQEGLTIVTRDAAILDFAGVTTLKC